MEAYATATELWSGTTAMEWPTVRLRWVERVVPDADRKDRALVRTVVLQQAWVIRTDDAERTEWRDVPVEQEGEG